MGFKLNTKEYKKIKAEMEEFFHGDIVLLIGECAKLASYAENCRIEYVMEWMIEDAKKNGLVIASEYLDHYLEEYNLTHEKKRPKVPRNRVFEEIK